MAKRLHDTEIWSKKWFRKASPAEKCLWFFAKDKCDFAGIWEPDTEEIEFYIGSIGVELEFIKDHLMKISDTKYFLIEFVKFQYGWPINEKSPMYKKLFSHLSAVSIKNGNTLWDTLSNTVSNTVKEKEKEEDKDKDKRKERKLTSRVELKEYAKSKNMNVDVDEFFDYWESICWRRKGGHVIKDREAALRNWAKNNYSKRDKRQTTLLPNWTIPDVRD